MFTRVWNTPDNGYAEKFKHSVEPYLTVSRTTAIDNFDNIVQLEGIDSIVPQSTLNYGVNNRFYAKRRPPRDSPTLISQAREILAVEFTQSYYSDTRGAQYDPRYQTSFGGQQEKEPSKFSPMQLSVRATPTDQFNATVRAEFDSRYLALRTISATGTYTINNKLNATANWTKTAFIPELAGFNDPGQSDAVHQRVDQRAYAGQPVRRPVFLQLRPAPFGDPAAAHHRLLQRTVLRRLVRVPDLQPQRHLERWPCRSIAGSSCRSRWPVSAISRRSTAR